LRFAYKYSRLKSTSVVSRYFAYTTLFRSNAGTNSRGRPFGLPPEGTSGIGGRGGRGPRLDGLPDMTAGPPARGRQGDPQRDGQPDRKSTRLNSSHELCLYAVFCLKNKKRV